MTSGARGRRSSADIRDNGDVDLPLPLSHPASRRSRRHREIYRRRATKPSRPPAGFAPATADSAAVAEPHPDSPPLPEPSRPPSPDSPPPRRIRCVAEPPPDSFATPPSHTDPVASLERAVVVGERSTMAGATDVSGAGQC